jgi:hypothetical protein
MSYSKIWVVLKISLVISLASFPTQAIAHSQRDRSVGDFTAATKYGVYPEWGNVCPYGEPHRCIADCVFASVADWEILALHRLPDEAAVEIAFAHAGGSPTQGINPGRAERWLHRVGLEGIHLAFKNVLYPPLVQMKRWVRHYRYLIAGWGDHEVAINGAGPHGPMIVTYGYEQELPWAEANIDLEELTEVQVAKA